MAETGYQVLARKWRPQLFAELAGLEHVARTLQNAIRRERVGHAYLFTGSRGVGKTSAARILAKALNCRQGPAPEPCNQCDNCRAITSGISPDVIEIDGASNRGVNEIRLLRDGVSYLPQGSKFKIYIIDEVHMLTTEAFNALLKTLEEPPAHVKFIMATTDVHKVPQTILSRCQRFDFGRLTQATIASSLREIAKKEGLEFESGSVELLAREARGSMRDALSLLDQVRSYAGDHISLLDLRAALGIVEARHCFELLGDLVRGEVAAAVARVETLEQAGVDLQDFSRELLYFLRDALFLKLSPQLEKLVGLGREESEALKPLLQQRALPYWQQLFLLWQEHYQRIRVAQIPRLALESGLIELGLARDLEPLDELLQRLKGNGDTGWPQSPAESGGGRMTAREAGGVARPAAEEAGSGGRKGDALSGTVAAASRAGAGSGAGSLAASIAMPEEPAMGDVPFAPGSAEVAVGGAGEGAQKALAAAKAERMTQPLSPPVGGVKEVLHDDGGSEVAGSAVASELTPERWERFCAWLAGRSQRLGAMLRRSRLKAIAADGSLQIAVPPYILEPLRKHEDDGEFLRQLQEFLGVRAGLRITFEPEAVPDARRGGSNGRSPVLVSLPGKDEIYREPAVRFISNRFGGRITEIRPRQRF